MTRSNDPKSRTSFRFGDLFRLSSWGTRQPWRSTEMEATTVELLGTRKLGAGKVRVQRRRKAA